MLIFVLSLELILVGDLPTINSFNLLITRYFIKKKVHSVNLFMWGGNGVTIFGIENSELLWKCSEKSPAEGGVWRGSNAH